MKLVHMCNLLRSLQKLFLLFILSMSQNCYKYASSTPCLSHYYFLFTGMPLISLLMFFLLLRADLIGGTIKGQLFKQTNQSTKGMDCN